MHAVVFRIVLYLFIRFDPKLTSVSFPKKNAKGLDLMHWVTSQLNISEKEYFGLLWEDKKGEKVGNYSCLPIFISSLR